MKAILRKEISVEWLIHSTLKSYSQIFFSENLWLACILLVVTYFDYYTGIAGTLAVITANLTALSLGFDKRVSQTGLYGFNSLLVGLGLGLYFSPSLLFFGIVALASVATLFFTIFIQGILAKYDLPYLSLPFLLIIWMFLLASREFQAIGLSDRGLFTINEIFKLGGTGAVKLYFLGLELPVPFSVKVYLVSLGAIFFQYNMFSGFLIAVGLLSWSRIAFLLSITGFYSAFLFYQLLGIELTETLYTYIGFNYILTSIAIGGFFLVPSVRSFAWSMFLVPLVAVVTIFSTNIMAPLHMSAYSLPFNLVVILFIFVLKRRPVYSPKLALVAIQNGKPEKNLYAYKNYMDRFRNAVYFNFILPVWGNWKVQQGHSGKHTHIGEWQNAWDLVIEGQDGKNFRDQGAKPEDFYCYDKNVICPADGTVEDIQDGVDDNPVGQMNLTQNWGNSIVVKHAEGLYSKISHLKAGSFKVVKGEYVKKGHILARSGNSGRSPEPHVHFQFQATPYIGSKTLKYPFAHYLTHKPQTQYRTYGIPEENEIISNIQLSSLLQHAFAFIPGQEITFNVTGWKKIKTEKWEVRSDAWNNLYLFCTRTKSAAYLKNDGTVHYFTHFEGSRNSLLYFFFLSAYKILLAYYPNIEVKDSIPLHHSFKNPLLAIHDMTAFAFFWLKASYKSTSVWSDAALNPSEIILESKTQLKIMNYVYQLIQSEIHINNNGLHSFTIKNKTFNIEAQCAHS